MNRRFLSFSVLIPSLLLVALPATFARQTASQSTPLPQSLGHLLLDAAKNGDTANVEALLAKGADVNFKAGGKTVLSAAAEAGQVEVVKLLLARGAKDDEGAAIASAYEQGHAEVEALLERAAPQPRPPKARRRLLFAAIHKGDVAKVGTVLAAGEEDEILSYLVSRDTASLEMVRLLLDRGAHVNQASTYMTPLMHAADRGHTQIVQLLLARGAQVNARTNEGTALLLAVKRGDPDTVRLLLDAGADVNARQRTGSSALILAAGPSFLEMNPRSGAPPLKASSAIMRLLLDKGAEVNAADSYGQTALMSANSAEKVKLLAARGADVNAKDQGGQSALMRAARRGDVEVVEALLSSQADVNARDLKGATALLHALESDRPYPRKSEEDYARTAQRLLLAQKVDVNAQNEDGETALMRAARLGYTEIVNLLVARGADVSALDTRDNSALVIAYEHGHTGIVKLLERALPQRPTPKVLNALLRTAIQRKDADKVKELLAAGADANYAFAVGYSHKDMKDTVFVLAAKSGDAGIVQMLLDNGADVNAKGLVYGSESGIKLGTALEAAEFHGHVAVISLLRQAASRPVSPE